MFLYERISLGDGSKLKSDISKMYYIVYHTAFHYTIYFALFILCLLHYFEDVDIVNFYSK